MNETIDTFNQEEEEMKIKQNEGTFEELRSAGEKKAKPHNIKPPSGGWSCKNSQLYHSLAAFEKG